MVLGLAAGASQLAGQASAASKNQKLIRERNDYNNAVASREMIADNQTALKEGYQATLEGDRAKSIAVASGAGTTGATPGLRVAEQSRQSALSIANAKDRADGARATYALQTEGNRMDAQHSLNKETLNPLSSFMDVATSGLSNYGAFK